MDYLNDVWLYPSLNIIKINNIMILFFLYNDFNGKCLRVTKRDCVSWKTTLKP